MSIIRVFSTILFTAPLVLITDVSALQKGELGDSNPFADEKGGSRIEPSGVISYDFGASPNSISESSSSRLYVEESRETALLGFAKVVPSRVRDFEQLIAAYTDAHAKLESRYAKSVEFASSGLMPRELAFDRSALSLLADAGFAEVLDVPRGYYVRDKGWDSSVRVYKNEDRTVIVSE